jgi:autotransporter-associated beta strand protein
VNYTAVPGGDHWTIREANPGTGFDGFFTSGSNLGLFANSGNAGSIPQAVAFRNFTVDGTRDGTPLALQVGQTVRIFVDLGSGGINGQSIGFGLNNGSNFTGVGNYNTGGRFEMSFTGGDSTAAYYDASGKNTSGMPNFTDFSNGITYEVSLLSSNEYTFRVVGGSTYNVRTLGGTSGAAINSFSVFNRGWNNADGLFGGIQVLNVTPTFTPSSGDTRTVTGVISNNAASGGIVNSVIVNGAGSVVFANAGNNYTGTTSVNSGTLLISVDSNLGVAPALPTDNLFIADSAAVRVTETMSLDANRNVVLGTSGGSGTGTLSVAPDKTLSAAGVIKDNGAGADSLAKGGGGTLILSADNTYTGETLIDSGTLSIAQGGDAGSTSAFVRMGASGSPASDSAAAVIIGDADGGTTLTNPFVIRGGSGTRTAGALNTSGTNTFSGNFFLDKSMSTVSASGGTVQFTGTSFDIKSHTLTVSGGGTTVITQGIDTSTSSGTVVKNDAGRLIVQGSSNYTGTTTINAGAIQMDGSHTGGSTYTVNANGTLAGNGTVGSNITLAGGGTLSPGASVGNLTVGGNVGGTGNLVIELTPSNATPGTTFDRLTFTAVAPQGNFGSINLVLVPLAGTYSLPVTYRVVSSTNAFATIVQFANTAGGVYSAPGVNATVSLGSNFVDVQLTSVPEPSAVAAGLLGALTLSRRRRAIR